MKALSVETDGGVCERLLRALAAVRDERDVAVMARFALCQDRRAVPHDLDVTATCMLGLFRNRAVVPVLEQVLARPNDGLGGAAVGALAQTPGPQAEAALIGASHHPPLRVVRRQARRALRRHRRAAATSAD